MSRFSIKKCVTCLHFPTDEMLNQRNSCSSAGWSRRRFNALKDDLSMEILFAGVDNSVCLPCRKFIHAAFAKRYPGVILSLFQNTSGKIDTFQSVVRIV